jgi:hypothetical protein
MPQIRRMEAVTGGQQVDDLEHESDLAALPGR